MYPDTVTNYSIEVECCNTINQCTTNGFWVNVTDQDPIHLTTGQSTTFIINYDSSSSVGQYWTWYPIGFSDPDGVSEPLVDPYGSQNHTVRITMTSTNPGFKSVSNIGLIFG